jgi:hypothetical protein
MNVGLLLLGLVGGVVVGFGLELQERRRLRRWNELTVDGVRGSGTVAEVTATGRYLAFRRVTVAVDGGGSFVQTIDGVEADRLGVVVGMRVGVWHRFDDPTDATLDIDERPATRWPIPLVTGSVIAALGLAASLVV